MYVCRVTSTTEIRWSIYNIVLLYFYKYNNVGTYQPIPDQVPGSRYTS